MRQAALLPEAALVLEPDLYVSVRIEPSEDLDKRGAACFQTASSSASFFGFTGRGFSGS